MADTPTCPTCRALAAEVARLRAQVAALRGEGFGRTDTDDPPAAVGPTPPLMVGYPRSALAQNGRRLHAEPSAPAYERVA